MSNKTNVFLNKLKKAVAWYEGAGPWHSEYGDVMAAASRQVIRDIESPGYIYVVQVDDGGEDGGSSVEAVYDNRQTADQHAERVYGYAWVSTMKVDSKLPDYLRSSK